MACFTVLSQHWPRRRMVNCDKNERGPVIPIGWWLCLPMTVCMRMADRARNAISELRLPVHQFVIAVN
jgi:hypothetical protein